MAYTDAGAVTTALPTKTSWANQVRNNQEDHESSIGTNETDIATNLATNVLQQATLVDHESRVVTLESALESTSHVINYNTQLSAVYATPGASLFGPVGLSVVGTRHRFYCGWVSHAGFNCMKAMGNIVVTGNSPWAYSITSNCIGNTGAGFLKVSGTTASGGTVNLTDTLNGHFFNAVFGNGLYDINIVKAAGVINTFFWIERL